MPISINAYWAAAAVVHCVWHIDHAIVAAVIVERTRTPVPLEMRGEPRESRPPPAVVGQIR